MIYNVNLFLLLHVCLKVNPVMSVHIYLIPGQYKIMFQRIFTLASSTINVLRFPGYFIKSPHLQGISCMGL